MPDHSHFLLTVAARFDRADLVEFLRDAGAKAQRSGLLGRLDADRPVVAEILVKAGFDVDDTVQYGPMLPRVCRPDVAKNSDRRAQLLIRLGADPNVLGRTGFAGLHYAVRGRNVELAKLLLAQGAKPDLPDRNGLRPEDHARLSRSKLDPDPVMELVPIANGDR